MTAARTRDGAPARPVRALLLCQSLAVPGGVERVACDLANHLAGQGLDVAVGSVDTPPGSVAYALDPAVRVLAAAAPVAAAGRAPRGPARALALLRNQWRTGRTLSRLVRAERPDVVVLNGLTTACSVLLFCPGCAARAICCDHNHFEARSRPWRLLRAWIYPRVAALVSLTEADAARFRALNPRTEVIPNASSLRADALPAPRVADDGSLRVLAIGRCVAQKGFDLLLGAWPAVVRQVPAARLRIVGDGPLRASLKAQALALGIADQVEWAAPTRAIEAHYRQADVFVLPSRYEGLPLVLLEAQALGVPAIAFDCPTGPAEILADGSGLLVPAGDVAALAAALARLLGAPGLRRRLAAAAWRRSREHFGREAHFERWTALVRAVAAEGPPRHA